MPLLLPPYRYGNPAAMVGPGTGSLSVGLAEMWEFEEGSGANRVGSVAGTVLTNNGTVGVNAAGKPGNAATFDGNGANFLRNSSPTVLSLTANGQFELAVWCYLADTNVSRCAFDLKDSTSNAIQVQQAGGSSGKWRVFARHVQIDCPEPRHPRTPGTSSISTMTAPTLASSSTTARRRRRRGAQPPLLPRPICGSGRTPPPRSRGAGG
jgi:hypothetical protein